MKLLSCIMPPFPVIDAILSPQHLAIWLTECYGLSNVTCSVFKTNMNHTYLATSAEGKYVLRIYSHKHRSHLQVSEELRVLEILRDNAIEAAYPVAATDDQFIQSINAPEGLRYAVLFVFAEGGKVRFLTNELSEHIGIVVGRFHVATSGQRIDRIDYNVKTLVGWAAQQVAQRFKDSTDELNFLNACSPFLEGAFNAAPFLRTGIVHLDIWYDNMGIREDGKITLYDFDNCGNGWLILDIGYYCMQLFYIETDKAEYERKKDAFIRGYRSVMPVTDEELQLIPYAGLAIWVHYLGLQTERFDSFANLFLSVNYIKMYLGRVKDWLQYHGLSVEP